MSVHSIILKKFKIFHFQWHNFVILDFTKHVGPEITFLTISELSRKIFSCLHKKQNVRIFVQNLSKLNVSRKTNGPRQANLVLIAYASSESRGTFRQKTRSLAPLNGWTCAVETCHDRMLKDTNSLDAAQIVQVSRIPYTVRFRRVGTYSSGAQIKGLGRWGCKSNLLPACLPPTAANSKWIIHQIGIHIKLKFPEYQTQSAFRCVHMGRPFCSGVQNVPGLW